MGLPTTRYQIVVDRRLVAVVIMVALGIAIAIFAKILGLGHEGRLWLSAALLGPSAALAAVYGLRLNTRQPASVERLVRAKERVADRGEDLANTGSGDDVADKRKAIGDDPDGSASAPTEPGRSFAELTEAHLDDLQPEAPVRVEFEVGDRVVYPHHGVGQVIRKEVREVLGESREYWR